MKDMYTIVGYDKEQDSRTIIDDEYSLSSEAEIQAKEYAFSNNAKKTDGSPYDRIEVHYDYECEDETLVWASSGIAEALKEDILEEIEDVLRNMCAGRNYREWSDDMIEVLFEQIRHIIDDDANGRDELTDPLSFGRLTVTEDMVVTAMMMYVNETADVSKLWNHAFD